MEKLQGIQYRRREDVSTMRFGPIQHDFFPSGKARTAISRTEESRYLQKRPLPPSPPPPSDFPLLDQSTPNHNTKADVYGDINWKDSWEWDSFLMSARPSLMKTTVPSQQVVHRDPSGNGLVSNGPTLLELGLSSSSSSSSAAATTTTTRRGKDDNDDNLLALKLGGNAHEWRPEELLPQQSVKRSRHSPPEAQVPRCQVDGCVTDLQNAKDYHRRHKVCEHHAKATKASVSGVVQRFCQQCSRFHLLREFDDDRRSCRRRLAGHNRRRRKNQPDTTAALACILSDQNALSRIINPLGSLQAKEEVDKLQKVLGSRETLLQTLMVAGATIGDTCNKSSALGADDLMNTIAKSQILSNLLLSNPNLACNLSPATTSTGASIAALSNAMLLSLIHQSQPKIGNNGEPITMTTNGRNLEACTNTFRPGNIMIQDGLSIPDLGLQPTYAAFPNTALSGEMLTPPVCSDNSNESNGDSIDERTHTGYAQRGGLHQEKFVRNGTNGNIRDCENSNDFLTSRVQTLGYAESTSPNERFEATVGSDHSSDSSLDKQEQTFQLWFKIFDRSPGDLPSSLRKQMLEWLDHLPTEMEGYIRPGCIILTVFICMPIHAWEKLCRDIEARLQELIWSSGGEFLRKGKVLVQLEEVSSLIVDGKVMPNTVPRFTQRPNLIMVQPFAVMIGEKVKLTLKGHNLRSFGTRVICSYEGKCVEGDVGSTTGLQFWKRDREGEQDSSLVETEEQEISFHVGPFNNRGHCFIEVEGQLAKGSSFPIIVVPDKAVCDDVSMLEEEFIRNLSDDAVAVGRPSNKAAAADITHFLYEFGWLLHRDQWKAQYMASGVDDFSAERYRWLLRFSAERGCCAIAKSILNLLFSTSHDRALGTISEASLLHIAVKSSSRAMVEFLLAYAPPSPDSGHGSPEQVFRPDAPSHGGLTPLHLAASMHSGGDEVLDALTNAPEELWAKAWTAAKDSSGQTPLMYALAAGRKSAISLVMKKMRHGDNKGHVALNLDADAESSSSPRRPMVFTQKIQACTCRGRELLLTQNLPLRIRGLRGGSFYRPFVLSMLTVAAVCVCVGVLMKGPPSVSFVQGPFVWESIRYGPK